MILLVFSASARGRIGAVPAGLLVAGIGSFVRVLVVVNLDVGEANTYRGWLEVFPEDLKLAWEVWETPSYAKLNLKGILANKLIGWPDSTLHKFVEVGVRNSNEVPYVLSSTDHELDAILKKRWNHTEVLNAIHTAAEDQKL